MKPKNVINQRRNGEIIENLSKVELPKELQLEIIPFFYKEAKYEREIRNKATTLQQM